MATALEIPGCIMFGLTCNVSFDSVTMVIHMHSKITTSLIRSGIGIEV